MTKSRVRRQSPTCLTPSPREVSPQPSSVLDDWDMASNMSSTSRPTSVALLSTASSTGGSSTRPPTLSEILSNSAPPPWTLSAFMAYLSQNHCLETLEFTMDADRYRAAHAQILQDGGGWVTDGAEQVCSLWQKLMQAYIIPYGPREVNLPSPVRDRLLGLPCTPAPPDPLELDEAVKIVYELMNDSVLVPFIESVSPAQSEHHPEEDVQDTRQGRSRLRTSKDQRPASSDEHSRSPKTSFLPQLNISRSVGGTRSPSASTEAADRVGLSDDSEGSAPSPPGMEPMTPPTTPPTSEWTFSTSPGSLQRAISAHNNGWKKVGAKLGFKRARFHRHSHTSNTSRPMMDEDVHMSDGSGGPL